MHSTSIEQAQDRVEALRRELREEVTEEVQANLRRREWRRRFFRIGGCCGAYLVALLAVPLVLGYVLARTGLVPVPILSGWVTHARAPSRVVVSADARGLERTLTERLARAFRPGRLPASISIPLSEGEVTALLRELLLGAGATWAVTARDAQVAVDREVATLFAHIPGAGGAESTLLISGVPSVRDGRLAFEPRAVVIGALPLPMVLARPTARFLTDRLPTLELPAERGMPGMVLDGIALADGTVTLTFALQR